MSYRYYNKYFKVPIQTIVMCFQILKVKKHPTRSKKKKTVFVSNEKFDYSSRLSLYFLYWYLTFLELVTAIAYVQPVALTSVIMLQNKWVSGSQQTRTSCGQDIMWFPFEKLSKHCWVHKFNLTILFLKINTKYYFYIQLGIISTCNIIEY